MSLTRTLLFAIGGVLLGGVIHIVIVLMLPAFSYRDAWTSMGRFGPDGGFHVLPLADPETEPFPYLDPHMALAVCRFTLDEPVHITAALTDDFWSVGLFDRRGRSVYSLNDRSAEGSQLKLVIVTPDQMAEIRQGPAAELESSILVELPISAGFVLLRVFIPDDSTLSDVSTALSTADCSNRL